MKEISVVDLVDKLEQEKLAGRTGFLASRLANGAKHFTGSADHHCDINKTGNESWRL
jgi:hypothetical protein